MINVTQEALEGNITVVRLNGRLDGNTSPILKARLEELLEAGQTRIIIDLEQVPFIDSSGLIALMSGLRMTREKKGKVVLSGAQAQAQTVFRLTMLDRIFAIHPTFQEARQSFL